MQIKTTVRYNSMSIKMASIKETDNTQGLVRIWNNRDSMTLPNGNAKWSSNW